MRQALQLRIQKRVTSLCPVSSSVLACSNTVPTLPLPPLQVKDLRDVLRAIGLSGEGGRYECRDRLLTVLAAHTAVKLGNRAALMAEVRGSRMHGAHACMFPCMGACMHGRMHACVHAVLHPMRACGRSRAPMRPPAFKPPPPTARQDDAARAARRAAHARRERRGHQGRLGAAPGARRTGRRGA